MWGSRPQNHVVSFDAICHQGVKPRSTTGPRPIAHLGIPALAAGSRSTL